MSEDGRVKISFGFAKKPPVNPKIKLAPKSEPTVEFISSVEGQEFETIGGKVEEKKEELVIPLVKTVPAWQKKLLKIRDGKAPARPVAAQNGIKTERDELDILAEQEILREAAEALQEREDDNKPSTIYMNLDEDDAAEEDKEEPTAENYEAIPVKDFGLAMLRGMGWEPGKGIGRNPKVVEVKEPAFRPRGMGLGVEAKKPVKKNTEEGQDLRMCKGAYVKVFQGPLQGCYGKVESLHDTLGRVLVRMTLGNKVQSICEYMLELVTVKEYNEKSRVVSSDNAALVQRSLDKVSNANGTTEKAYGLVHLKKRDPSPENIEKKRERSPERRKKHKKRNRSREQKRSRSSDRRDKRRSPERRKRSKSPHRRR
ncbi:G-patch domain and KOW motifs-containing protein [Neocloeon triangulifer]|uniref:G-patch domain and KOW motifs-containing protein n=1 Tax=Neocloeon triangulifer TaxID=2078957 RepID=UPI00286F9619|nr:G-patch domain and KOW motifs-containing protein [Neocloeon triangulifer]XP_059469003.1 G-patch domain and KOW motifs-containing protein [Neocloeon triangulifer]